MRNSEYITKGGKDVRGSPASVAIEEGVLVNGTPSFVSVVMSIGVKYVVIWLMFEGTKAGILLPEALTKHVYWRNDNQSFLWLLDTVLAVKCNIERLAVNKML